MSHNFCVNKQEAIQYMNRLGSEVRPFLFIVDFQQKTPLILPLDEIDEQQILFTTPLVSNSNGPLLKDQINLQISPITKDEYAFRFEKVVSEIKRGNSFVVNLTCQTPVGCSASLLDIFHSAQAPYKLWIEDQFVCFSPETFVKIIDGEIITCPMKGTIDASLPNAATLILNDKKEQAEHNCIVDLLRNDLSMIAEEVEVTRYRYIDEVVTSGGNLLQVSSEIRGKLSDCYQCHLGDILFSMLPAGSITGAPKIKTTQIIDEVELYDRGYYTGVFGVFDGKQLDSAVMIRFIENTLRGMVYKSGGGITAKSVMADEYNEMIKKIYVPVAGKY